MLEERTFSNHFDRKSVNSIVFIGDNAGGNNIRLREKPSFYDAMLISEKHLISIEKSLYYKCIPLSFRTVTKTFHFHEFHQPQKMKCIFHSNSIKIIDSEPNVTMSTICRVVKHFLIKRENKILFLTEMPNDKTMVNKKDPSRS